MVFTKLGILMSATVVASALVTVGINQPVVAKTKKHTTRGRGAYFVPPPPPYAPSILPEQAAHVTVATEDTEEAVKQPENPYKKYIFTRNQADMPRVVQPNRYVSYYHKG